MIIKKFVAKTEREATEDAERELGRGIVIMNVRPVKQEGFLAFLRPPRVEVTVALEDEPDEAPPPNRQYPGNGGRERIQAESGGARQTVAPQRPREREPQLPQMPESAPPRPRDATPAERLVQATREGTLPPLNNGGGFPVGAPGGGAPQRTLYEPAPAAAEPPRRAAPSRDSSVGALEEKLDSLHTLLEERIGPPKEDKKEEEGGDAKASTDVSKEMLTFVKLLYNTLLANEVDEIYANQLTDEVEKMSKRGFPLEHVLANVYQKMVLKFGKSETIEQDSEGGPKPVFFIGPTGVGKTTTIAKIASNLFVMKRKKVALLTVDTYRIAAAEQLKTYASIMEIPCRVIYSVEEMRKTAEELKRYDFLLVDTPGHSMHNVEQRGSIEGFLHAFDGILPTEVFLVLSATTKYRDLLDIVDIYSEMAQYRLIFTKLDETKAAGNLYNIKMHTGAPMSYITNGQNVPDDIAVFDAQSVVKGLLGGKKSIP